MQITLVAFLAAFAIVAVVMMLLGRLVVQPIQGVVEVVRRIADGDLTDDIEIKRQDEVGQLLSAMQGMVDKLRTHISDVSRSVVGMDAAAGDLTQASGGMSMNAEDASNRATAVAAAAEQINGAINSVSSGIGVLASTRKRRKLNTCRGIAAM